MTKKKPADLDITPALTAKDLKKAPWHLCVIEKNRYDNDEVTVPKEISDSRGEKVYGPSLPYRHGFKRIYVAPKKGSKTLRGGREVEALRWASVDADGNIWECDDGYSWVPSMTEESRRALAERISQLVEESNSRMAEAAAIAEAAGLTFRMRADAEFHGFPVTRGDEWYGGWESSYC